MARTGSKLVGGALVLGAVGMFLFARKDQPEFIDPNADAKQAENLAQSSTDIAGGITDLAASTGSAVSSAGRGILDFFESVSNIFTSVKVGSGVDPKDALMLKEPRGIRNNNPGNIRIGAAWQGSIKPNTDGSFVQFETPQYGIRAMAKVLNTYNKRHGLKTIRDIIKRWAPSNENNTEAYVSAVSSFTSHAPDEEYDIYDPVKLRSLMVAITRVENGRNPYPDTTFDEGIAMAGLKA